MKVVCDKSNISMCSKEYYNTFIYDGDGITTILIHSNNLSQCTIIKKELFIAIWHVIKIM